MKFIQRMKKDKKFRIKTIIIGVLLVFLFTSMGGGEKEELTQAHCNQANRHISGSGLVPGTFHPFCTGFSSSVLSTIGNKCLALDTIFGGYGLDQDSQEECIALSCNIGTAIVDSGLDSYACFAKVPDGVRAQSADACENDFINQPNSDAEGYDFLCKAYPPGTDIEDVECNSAERGIAQVLMSVMPSLKCKTAYYMVLIGGAFLALIIFAAI